MAPRSASSASSSISSKSYCSSLSSRKSPSNQNLRDQIKAVIEQDLLAHHELSAHEVPGGLRERYISGHYRKPHKNFSSYLGSIFQIHNESLNIWTAIIRFLALGDDSIPMPVLSLNSLQSCKQALAFC